MDSGQVAYRVRLAEPADEAALKAAIGATLVHPDELGKRGSYKGAAAREDLLLLEHFDRQERSWQVAGFIEFHQRVDDTITIRDVGTAGEVPNVGTVRYLLDQLVDSYHPESITVKIRRDASRWLEIFEAVSGFAREGDEYRRPHYWTVWSWDAARARAASASAARPRDSRAGASAPGSRFGRPELPPRSGSRSGAARDPRAASRGSTRPRRP